MKPPWPKFQTRQSRHRMSKRYALPCSVPTTASEKRFRLFSCVKRLTIQHENNQLTGLWTLRQYNGIPLSSLTNLQRLSYTQGQVSAHSFRVDIIIPSLQSRPPRHVGASVGYVARKGVEIYVALLALQTASRHPSWAPYTRGFFNLVSRLPSCQLPRKAVQPVSCMPLPLSE